MNLSLETNGSSNTLLHTSLLQTKRSVDSLEKLDVVSQFRYVRDVSVCGYRGTFERALQVGQGSSNLILLHREGAGTTAVHAVVLRQARLKLHLELWS